MADITLMTLNFTVPGCTDESAANYNPAATADDGSCIALSFFNCYEETGDSVGVSKTLHYLTVPLLVTIPYVNLLRKI